MFRKRGAYEFLSGLEAILNQKLPEAAAMKERMANIATQGTSPSQIRENIFLYHILPLVSDYMQTIAGIGPSEARQSMLCEYHAKVPTLASGNCFRRLGHPFRKTPGLSINQIAQTWIKSPGVLPLNQAFPDFGFRSPFPYKIVFDAKYFTQNSEAAAYKALVEGSYEAMFYRGLPQTPPTVEGDAGWDFEFGCLLAYDASTAGILKKAWKAVTAKQNFWDGANIYIMIISGQQAQAGA